MWWGGRVQVKSSKLTVQGSLVSVGSSLPKKRSLQDRQDMADDLMEGERPRKRHSILADQLEGEKQRNGVNGSGSKPTEPKIPIDIQAMLATTRKQIEERKKQTENLLAAQKQAVSQTPASQEASSHPSQAATKPAIAAVIQQQIQMLQQQGLPGGPQQASIHPHAFHREVQLAYGATAGPSALDQALKNAEVSSGTGAGAGAGAGAGEVLAYFEHFHTEFYEVGKMGVCPCCGQLGEMQSDALL